MNTRSWSPLEAAAAMAGPVGRLLLTAHRRSRVTMAAFDTAVAPILARTIADPDLMRRTATVLRSWSVKGSHIVGSYAHMAGIPFPAETCAVGTTFARIYDDLLDETDQLDFAERVGALLRLGDFTPINDLERAMKELFRELIRRLARDSDDPIFAAGRELHRYQRMSRGQATGVLSPAEIDAVTLGKGGLSLVVLFALARRSMPPAERALVEQLGGTLQLLDDYQDWAADRRRGIRTPATAGRLRLIDIHRRLNLVAPQLHQYYGPDARTFLRELYLFQLVALTGRYRSRLVAPRPPTVPRRRTAPLWVLIRRGGSVVANGEHAAC